MKKAAAVADEKVQERETLKLKYKPRSLVKNADGTPAPAKVRDKNKVPFHLYKDAECYVTLPQWFMYENHIASRELVGTVLDTNYNAFLFAATAVVRESSSCLRCGRDIENPISILAGYGPICSDILGIDRVFDPSDIEAVRETVRKNSYIEMWIPAPHTIVDVISNPVPENAPPVQTLAPTPLREHADRVKQQEDLEKLQQVVTKDTSQSFTDKLNAYVGSVSTHTPIIPAEYVPPVAPVIEKHPDYDIQIRIEKVDGANRIVVKGDTYELRADLRMIPTARWNPFDRWWHYEVSDMVAKKLIEMLKGKSLRIVGSPEIPKMVQRANVILQANSIKDAEVLADIPITNTDMLPWEHQTRAYNFVAHLFGDDKK